MTAALDISHISKIYGDGDNRVVAVDDVTLSLAAGEVVLIEGPSGSGKTTLLSMMGCILRPTHGEVRLAGKLVRQEEGDALAGVRLKHIGFMFQAFNLFPALNAEENVELVLRLKAWPRATRRQEAHRLLDLVGLGARCGHYPEQLSGGEKQRVAFARALAGEPPLLLADEPTANLDSQRGREVLALVRELAVSSAKAVVIVSHDPKAEAFAHRVVRMEDGRLCP